MTKEEHLLELKEQYIELSRQYLQKLHEGKTLRELVDLRNTISILITEIEEIDASLRKGE